MKHWVIALVLLMAFLGGAMVYIVSVVRQAEPAEPNLYAGISYDKKLLELDRRALDEAYHTHLIKLWTVWLTDGAKEAHRFSNGLRISRQAYHQAAEQLDRREKELDK